MIKGISFDTYFLRGVSIVQVYGSLPNFKSVLLSLLLPRLLPECRGSGLRWGNQGLRDAVISWCELRFPSSITNSSGHRGVRK